MSTNCTHGAQIIEREFYRESLVVAAVVVQLENAGACYFTQMGVVLQDVVVQALAS